MFTTWYIVIGTLSRTILILASCPSRQIILNVQLRVLKEEVGIRNPYKLDYAI